MTRTFREITIARRAKAVAQEMGERIKALEFRPDGSFRVELASSPDAVLASKDAHPPPCIVPPQGRRDRAA